MKTYNPSAVSDVIAVDDDVIAVDDAEAAGAGAIVLWDGVAAAPWQKYADAWRESGLGAAVPPCNPTTPATALGRACNDACPAGWLVRPRSRRREGFALVEEVRSSGSETNRYWVKMEVFLADGQIDLTSTAHCSWEEESGVATGLRVAFVKHLLEVQKSDLGAWLAKTVEIMQGVRLKAGGGTYYLPPDSVPRWKKAREALAPWMDLHSVVAMKSADAVRLILSSFSAEIAEAADGLESELESEDPLGSRALKTRIDGLESRRKKIAKYEGVLGQPLGDLRAKVERLDGMLWAAQATAEAREAEEKK